MGNFNLVEGGGGEGLGGRAAVGLGNCGSGRISVKGWLLPCSIITFAGKQCLSRVKSDFATLGKHLKY